MRESWSTDPRQRETFCADSPFTQGARLTVDRGVVQREMLNAVLRDRSRRVFCTKHQTPQTKSNDKTAFNYLE